MSRIAIIGCGTVGTAIGEGFKQFGNEVTFYDINKGRVKTLLDLNLDATIDLDQAIRKSDFSFICVPTPIKNGFIDLSDVKSAVEGIARCLKDKSAYHVVVIKSTVIPTSTEKVIIPILEELSCKKTEVDIGICVNPEFLTEVHGSWTDNTSFVKKFFTEDRVVIGELNKSSGDAVQALYEPLKAPIIRTNLRTAEMIKYASNCALASRISYWNEIYYVCQHLEIDSQVVAEVAAMDKRIGEYGTIHGKAFGGRCLPKDLKAFISFCEDLGYEPEILKAVMKINEKIKLDRGVRE